MITDITDTAATVAYIGNFHPPHSTENHVAAALERIGVEVLRYQENDPDTWATPTTVLEHEPDVILWTRTGWDWPAVAGWTIEEAHDRQHAMLAAARAEQVMTVGYHLDRWFGLDRAGQVDIEPFFRCDLVCTADGGHQDEWKAAGVNHLWFPPGVSAAECERPMDPTSRIHRLTLRTPVVWVGSWRSYHPEWLPYRQQLVHELTKTYGRRAAILPRPNQGLRGADLTNLYGTAKIVVGDSCLAGGATHYWSDRVPETIGRGGILVHPEVDGLEGDYPVGALTTYPIGDWDKLHEIIHDALATDDGMLAEIRVEGRAWVLAHHTYEQRMLTLLELLDIEVAA